MKKVIFILAIVLTGQSIDAQIVAHSAPSNGAAASSNRSHTIVGVVGSSFIGVVDGHGFIDHLGFWSGKSGIGTGVEPDPAMILPANYRLYQNYPNPFNPTTQISFDLPKQSNVTIFIYNTAGQRIRQLADSPYEAGSHSVIWNGKDELGKPVASGLYLYTIRASGFVRTRKMVKLK